MSDELDQEFETTPDYMEQLGVGEKKPKLFKEERPEKYGLDIEMDWIIHYANLITILMFFFMILYAFSSLSGANYEKAMAGIQKQMGGSDAQLQKIEKQEKETEMASAMEGFIKDKKLDEFAKVETNAQRVKISLANPILFDLGSSDLKAEAVPALKEIGSLIKNSQNLVIVDGHTDNVPVTGKKFRSNFELSAARAFSVIKYFIEVEKIDPSRFSAFGYGEYRPVFANDTEDNRGRNRRIEINIMRS
jgi:chemotaxis protein MotB